MREKQTADEKFDMYDAVFFSSVGFMLMVVGTVYGHFFGENGVWTE